MTFIGKLITTYFFYRFCERTIFNFNTQVLIDNYSIGTGIKINCSSMRFFDSFDK